MRAMFNGETVMNKVAFDVGRGLQHYPQCTHRAEKAATDHHVLRNYATLELRVLAKHERDAMDVALNSAIDMKLALRCYIAGDRQVFADRRNAASTRIVRAS